MNKIKCPKCESDDIGMNAFSDLIPLDEYMMYTCRECNEQFNPHDCSKQIVEEGTKE